jgi:hypothetical protein
MIKSDKICGPSALDYSFHSSTRLALTRKAFLWLDGRQSYRQKHLIR